MELRLCAHSHNTFCRVSILPPYSYPSRHATPVSMETSSLTPRVTNASGGPEDFRTEGQAFATGSGGTQLGTTDRQTFQS